MAPSVSRRTTRDVRCSQVTSRPWVSTVLPLELFDEGEWCEGPVWAPSLGGLIFSDVRRNRMMLIRESSPASTARPATCGARGDEPALGIDGVAVGIVGGLAKHLRAAALADQHHPVAAHVAEVTVLADRYDGGRLNAPNDVVVARDGAIWFSDPTYGPSRVPDSQM
jgi:gluconolactonase